MSYMEEQTAAGFHDGDLVMVTRVARDREGGWRNGWASEWMDQAVGHVFLVRNEPASEGGISLSDGYAYPYFVLKKVSDVKTDHIKVGTVLIKKETPGCFYIVEAIDNKSVMCRTTAPTRAEHHAWHSTLYELALNFEVIK